MNIKELHETNYEHYYVTTDGEVYSWYGKKPVLCMKHHDNGNGYVFVVIYGKKLYVHRLMGETFLGLDLNSNLQINHKNKVRDDNRLCNLEIVTRSENMKHAYAK